jgi:hypothetical protein
MQWYIEANDNFTVLLGLKLNLCYEKLARWTSFLLNYICIRLCSQSQWVTAQRNKTVQTLYVLSCYLLIMWCFKVYLLSLKTRIFMNKNKTCTVMMIINNVQEIPRWRLEVGSRKRASYSEILERRWRHTLQA